MEENSKSILPKEVNQKLQSGSNSFILVDLRDINEYNDWNIKGSINLPVNPLISAGDVKGLKDRFKSLPADKEIITICASGINSQVATVILNEMNYNSVYMKDGMKGWNENFNIYEIDFEKFKVIQFVRIGKGCISYIVYSKKKLSAFVVDPSIFTYEYTDYIKDHFLNVKYVLDSHSHADHFSGAMVPAKTLEIDHYINNIDVDSSSHLKSIKDIPEVTLGDIKIKIIDTPGHTDGSVSFLINDEALICGDLLLLESVGRPDLARGKEETIKGAEKLYNTVQNTVLKLDDSVKIFPAHFTKTVIRPVTLTLKELKKFNDSLTISDKEQFIKFITENIPVTPPNYESIKKYNKAGIIISMDYAEDLEIGPNRCAAR
jgi:glyoxylase-like metal-dependent hydrolase (beta-lactamase superfamily II)/rhodanese-related sulfurtransferase